MKRWIHSVRHSLRGISVFIREGRNARIQLGLAAMAILTGIWLEISLPELSILLLISAAVLAAEAFNSALEKLADHLHPARHPEIRNVKDIAAGAVMLLATGALITGILILGPHLWALFD